MINKPPGLPICLTLFILFISACDKDNDSTTGNEFRFYKTITVDGRARTYLLNLPPNYHQTSGFALVVAMHGGGGDANQFESTSRLTDKANASGFIVVYPEGVESSGPLRARTWNAGKCCAYASETNIDDVNFITQLIDNLTTDYKIDPRKVYATGHSNGGMLSYRLACEIPDKIAAIAPNGCSMVVKQPCSPSRSVPVLHMHSVLDTRVPYTGGNGVINAYFPPIDSVLNVWSLNNACATPAQVLIDNNDYKLTKWLACHNNVTIEYYLTKDGGHAWPGGLPGSQNGDTPSVVINANDLLWDFFKNYQLP